MLTNKLKIPTYILKIFCHYLLRFCEHPVGNSYNLAGAANTVLCGATFISVS